VLRKFNTQIRQIADLRATGWVLCVCFFYARVTPPLTPLGKMPRRLNQLLLLFYLSVSRTAYGRQHPVAGGMLYLSARDTLTTPRAILCTQTAGRLPRASFCRSTRREVEGIHTLNGIKDVPIWCVHRKFRFDLATATHAQTKGGHHTLRFAA